jgi:hypothetical protein
VQRLADQPAGVEAVLDLADRAERTGEPEPLGDDAGQLDGGGGHQPDPLPGVEVLLRERPGAGPDPALHELVVDLLAVGDDVGDRLAGDQAEGLVARLGDRVEVLRPRTRNASCCQPKRRRSFVVISPRPAMPLPKK